MTWEENQYLIHYGVKGQKHGVRRYQNEDGTLTAEGKERYGQMTNRGADETRGLIRRSIESGKNTGRVFSEWRMGRHQKHINKINDKYGQKLEKAKNTKADTKKIEEKRDKKLAKYESKKEAQSAANSDLKAYRDHSSTAKLFLRSASYEKARARGNSRAGAIVETLDPTRLIAMHRNKKKYGKRIIFSDTIENEYNAMAMDRD